MKTVTKGWLLIAGAVLIAFVLQACQQGIDSKTSQRINSLYAHSILMRDEGTQEQLQRVGFEKQYIVNDTGLSYEQKISNMENAFGVWPSGNMNEKVSGLENKMVTMMQRWLS